MAKLIGNAIIRGKIETLTGMHIGGSSDSLQIGGVDSPVIRDPNTKYPYIPGSSLKGKMRMLTEFALGLAKDGGPVTDPSQIPAQIYGSSAEDAKIGPTRLVVRDAYPDVDTIKMWEKLESDHLFTEEKGENTIDRITSKANPRFIERIVRGSRFDLELIYSFYDLNEDSDIEVNEMDNFSQVFKALNLLEHSTLGGHGSRGYGRIQFLLFPIQFFTIEDYQMGKAVIKELGDLKKLSELDLESEIEILSNKMDS